MFAAEAKLITSISFLPICDITPAIIALENHLSQELQPVFDWYDLVDAFYKEHIFRFFTNYTGRLRMDGTRNRSRFDPAIWSVHQRALQGGDRTNNYSESAHKKLQRAFSL